MDQQQLEETREVIAWWEDRQRRHIDDADVPLTAIVGEYLRQRHGTGCAPTLNEEQVTGIMARYDQHGHPRPRCP